MEAVGQVAASWSRASIPRWSAAGSSPSTANRAAGRTPRGLAPFVAGDRHCGLELFEDDVDDVAVDPLGANRQRGAVLRHGRGARNCGPRGRNTAIASSPHSRPAGSQCGDASQGREELLMQAEYGFHQTGPAPRPPPAPVWPTSAFDDPNAQAAGAVAATGHWRPNSASAVASRRSSSGQPLPCASR